MPDLAGSSAALGVAAFAFTGYNIINQTANWSDVLSADPNSVEALAKLRHSELTSCALIGAVGLTASVLSKSLLPMFLAALTIGFGVISFEKAFAFDPRHPIPPELIPNVRALPQQVQPVNPYRLG